MLAALLCAHATYAQTDTAIKKAPTLLSGTIKNEKGEPLSGVTILVKGTQSQALSDDKGMFHIAADPTATLEFTHIGYSPLDTAVAGTAVSIVMRQSQGQLTEVVVTALGIRRSQPSLTYATQQVSGDQLTNVKTDNLMNALNGKVAGLTVSPSASGVGGSAKVILRGNRSASGNNQPLYVIDGIPISNANNANGQPAGTYGGTPDGGDGISNLNPEDIASISVLEGASAAALYGSQAENGVILITTKRGRPGVTQINFNSSIFADQVAYKPKFQNSFGETTSNSTDSWGAAINGGHDNLNDFFRTGMNFTNAISLSGGSEKAQTYFSYANTDATGIQPNNKLQRNNLTLHETARLLKDKLTVDGNVSYITQKINNSPAIGIYENPLTGLYLFPRGRDISPYKNQWLNADSTGFARQNWPINDGNLYQQNPWWITNEEPSVATRNRILFNASLRYEVASWLNIQARGNIDYINDNYEQDLHSGTLPIYNNNGHGHMTLNQQTTEQKYGDVIANFNIPMKTEDYKISGIVGTSITDTKVTGSYISGDLSTPDFFTEGNVIASLAGLTSITTSPATQDIPPGTSSPFPSHSEIQSVFGELDLSYKNWLYINGTGRNDWSSNLSYTPNESFFYPSVGASVILSEILKLPQAIDYAKVRGSFAQVGNTVPPYLTNIQNTQNSSGQLVFNTADAFRTLKPEKTNSWEIGTEWRFLNSRLDFTATLYKSNTKNQYFPISPVTASLYSTGYVNAGNIENKGIEMTVSYAIIRDRHFTWTTMLNGALNRNKILDVDAKDSINTFVLTANGNNAYESHLTKGGQYGDIYGYTVVKNTQGQIVFNGDGSAANPYKPQQSSTYNLLGNPNPRYQLGWRNDFDIYKFAVSFLVDGKFGGQVLSLTQGIMDQYGVSQVTGEARLKGGVAVNGVDATGKSVTSVDPQTWYEAIGGRNGITGEYMYSATVVRLREASVGYALPIPPGFFKQIKLSLVGRNLVYFTKKAPFDPELTMSTGNGLSGVDVFNQPATRNFGVSLNASF